MFCSTLLRLGCLLLTCLGPGPLEIPFLGLIVPHVKNKGAPLVATDIIFNGISLFLGLYSWILHFFSSSAAAHHGNTLNCHC